MKPRLELDGDGTMFDGNDGTWYARFETFDVERLTNTPDDWNWNRWEGEDIAAVYLPLDLRGENATDRATIRAEDKLMDELRSQGFEVTA